MTATQANTTPAANAVASTGSDDGSGRPRGDAEKPTSSGGIFSSIRQWWPASLATLEGPRKFTINGMMVIASLLGSGVVVKATLNQVAVVEAISVPKDLEGDGYTPATVGQRLIDAVSEINRTAAMAKRIGIYAMSELEPSRPDSTDSDGPNEAYATDPTFSLTCDDPAKKYDVSVGGVSLTTVILYVRELFGMSDTRISGEITVDNSPAPGAGKDGKPGAKKFAMRLRITNKGNVEQEAEATDKLETLFEQTALKLVERFDPINAAYYSYYNRDFDNALRIVRGYRADPAQKDDEWAANLEGLLEHARSRRDAARAEQGFDRAIAEFRKLQVSDPQFAPALYNLGYVLIDKGRKRQAAGDKEAAYDLFNEAYKVALEGIRAHEAADKGSRWRAEGYATAGHALRQLGRWEKSKYDEALRYFELSIEADRMFLAAYLGKGAIYERLKVPAEANAVYQLATEHNPSAATFTRVGAVLRRHDRHDESVPMFQKAAEIKPSAKAFTYWGMALRDSHQTEEAKAIFVRAIDADPTVANGYNQLGLLYLDQSQWDDAAEQFGKAIKLAPLWSNYHYNLGLAYSRSGKFGPAIESFNKAIAIYPSHAWSHAELGAALAEREIQEHGTVAEEAARSVDQKLKRAVELKPTDKTVLETVAEVYRRLGRFADADDVARRAAAATDWMQGGLDAEIKHLDRAAGEF